jgi:hypothetical protein
MEECRYSSTDCYLIITCWWEVSFMSHCFTLGEISRSTCWVWGWVISFNRTQSRVVIGLLTGHNTLRRCFHLLGLTDSPLCRKCGVEEETSAHILCECEALASLRHVHVGSFFLESEDIKSIILGTIWNFSKTTELPWNRLGAQRAH